LTESTGLQELESIRSGTETLVEGTLLYLVEVALPIFQGIYSTTEYNGSTITIEKPVEVLVESHSHQLGMSTQTETIDTFVEDSMVDSGNEP
jgi:hypothetical protein